MKQLLRELDVLIDDTTARLSLGGGRATTLVQLFEKHAPETELGRMMTISHVAMRGDKWS